ncbi:ABC transporter substrate-binding protein [Larsenimonas rhizosphaerae]|uniref:ABC transporter substrate-binding protein n=1 Tax=Larsenimonas rhizosphaerae TaxID=2944682 RepID=UPI0020347ED0|nr:ABC transporter substrate-binding protein [Larsenimonas rhizosphaerae]MCM2132008.1 ABC transporter substrate-binding protein [Larsenimonas rhizosphaerae]
MSFHLKHRLTHRGLQTVALIILLVGSTAHASAARPQTTLTLEAQTPQHAQLRIDGAVDEHIIAPVLTAFQAANPHVRVVYRNFSTEALYHHYDHLPDQDSADLVISSAMSRQYALVNEGHAQPLGASISDHWPRDALWRNELVGLSFEPIVMVFRQDLLKDALPRSHEALLEYLTTHREALQDKVVTYNPAKSDTGFTFTAQDAQQSPGYWSLINALGGVHAVQLDSTRPMLEGLAAGRYVIGYNLIGSYAFQAARDNPALTVVVPEDYALVLQRLAFIPRSARHPNAARHFLAFYTSEAGQQVVATQAMLGALHPATRGPGSASALKMGFGGSLRPIHLSPGLMALVDPLKRQSVLSRWQREFTRNTPPPDDSIR